MPSFFGSEQRDFALSLQSAFGSAPFKPATLQGAGRFKRLFARALGFCFDALLRFFLSLAVAVSLTAPKAEARGISLISDEETESLMRDYAAPILRAAGLDPDNIHIYLVNDDSLNAYVTAGNRMFINTGLIVNSDDPRQVIGVMAHETGHIAGHHLTRRQAVDEQSALLVLGSFLLGIGAAVATREVDAAAAIVKGGGALALHNQRSFSRRQESAADQAAVKYLTATKQSPEGLLNFMEMLEGQEVLLGVNQSPFLRTHPLTSQRMDFLRNQTAQSPYKDVEPNPDFVERHARVRAKLEAFLGDAKAILAKYPDSNQSQAARYARAIAYYRSAQQEKALEILDALLAEVPDDPYFLGLKGQIFFEFGNGHAAIPLLEKAVNILPKANSIRYFLIRTLVEENTPENDAKALENIHYALNIRPSHSGLWRQAAIVYGRQDNKVMTSLALAESAFARGRMGDAIRHGERVLKISESGSRAFLRASDLLSVARERAKR